MYLHFEFHGAELKLSFPLELGGIETDFSGGRDRISNNFFSIDSNPFFEIESGTGFLGKVKKINLFVGENNSGKSRFLRSLFKMDCFVSEDEISPLKIYSSIKNNAVLNNTKETRLLALRKQYDLLEDLFLNPYKIDEIEKQLFILEKAYKEESQKSKNVGGFIEEKLFKECVLLINEMLKFLDKLKFNNLQVYKSKIYIPIYRTLVEDGSFQRQAFEKIIENKYGISKNIFTGQRLYSEVLKKHTSSRIIELDAFSEWIKKNFNENKNVRIIPDDESGNILLNIDGNLTPIYDLGDGVQQLILLMFPIYTAEDGTWFFIEEPETHLHPGLQRIFIETLLNDEHLKKKNLRFFFTTHSNHFLDISLDHEEISIFQFEKESSEKFNIKTNVKPSKEILDLLGVNTSSVFLANTSIWVEGPTDRKYISKWLKLYCEHKGLPYLKEDIDFAFFEYGGNLIEHYLFDKNFDEDVSESQVRKKIKAFTLSNKVYLLADNDNIEKGSAKYKRRENLQSVSDKNFKYQNTEYREIENLLPVKVISDFIPELVKEHEGYEGLEFNRSDYYSKGLGDYFESVLKPNFDCKKFKAPSGTLNNLYKNKLCDFFINGNYSYSDLIEDNTQLEEIIESLYEFLTSK